MKYLYNDPILTERRRALRSNMTKAETVLWERLRNRRFADLRFRRQFGVDRFILDFYCPSIRLAIEVDGFIHTKTVERDRERDEIISSANIRILRVTNDDVFHNIELVLEKIRSFISPLIFHTPPFDKREGGRDITPGGTIPSISPCAQGECQNA